MVVEYKVTAKKSVDATEAVDPGPTRIRQATIYSTNTGTTPLVWTKIVVALQFLMLNMKLFG